MLREVLFGGGFGGIGWQLIRKFCGQNAYRIRGYAPHYMSGALQEPTKETRPRRAAP